MFIAKFLLVLVLDTAINGCWTYYLAAMSAKRPLASGLWAAILAIVVTFNTIQYTSDRRLVVAMVLGSFLGTTLTVWREKRKLIREAGVVQR